MAEKLMKGLLGMDADPSNGGDVDAGAPPDGGDGSNPFDALQPDEAAELEALAQQSLDAGEFEYTPPDVTAETNEPDEDADDKNIPGEPSDGDDEEAPPSSEDGGGLDPSSIADEAKRLATEAAQCSTNAAKHASDAAAFVDGDPKAAAKAAKACADAAKDVQEAAEEASDAAENGDWAGAGAALQKAQEAYVLVQQAEAEAESNIGAPAGLLGPAKGAKKGAPPAPAAKGKDAAAPPAKAAKGPKHAMLAWRDSK